MTPNDDSRTIDVTVRAYGPLNDFLPAADRQITCRLQTHGRCVKDLVESLGVPHPEIDLVLVNGESVTFDYPVRNGDRIAVFPRFMAFDVETLTRVRADPLHPIRFVADVHLGRLSRRLRLAGLDTAYWVDANDAALAEIAAREGRLLLTRDHTLLKRRAVVHGYFIRETRPHRQFVEVLQRFGPLDLRPFSRCPRCNDLLREVPKSAVVDALQPRTRQHYDRFQQCSRCGHIYWRGSHWKRLMQALDAASEEAGGSRHNGPQGPASFGRPNTSIEK